MCSKVAELTLQLLMEVYNDELKRNSFMFHVSWFFIGNNKNPLCMKHEAKLLLV